MAVTEIVSISRTVDQPIGRIWAVVAAFGADKLWMPDVVSTSVEGFGVGALRTMVFASAPGISVYETLVVADPVKHHIRVRVERADVDAQNYGNIILNKVDEGTTHIRWFGETDMPVEYQAVWVPMLTEMYTSYIDSILSKI